MYKWNATRALQLIQEEKAARSLIGLPNSQLELDASGRLFGRISRIHVAICHTSHADSPVTGQQHRWGADEYLRAGVSAVAGKSLFCWGGAELCAELCYREKGELEMLEDLFTDAALLTARPHFLTARLESIPHAD